MIHFVDDVLCSITSMFESIYSFCSVHVTKTNVSWYGYPTQKASKKAWPLLMFLYIVSIYDAFQQYVHKRQLWAHKSEILISCKEICKFHDIKDHFHCHDQIKCRYYFKCMNHYFLILEFVCLHDIDNTSSRKRKKGYLIEPKLSPVPGATLHGTLSVIYVTWFAHVHAFLICSTTYNHNVSFPWSGAPISI